MGLTGYCTSLCFPQNCSRTGSSSGADILFINLRSLCYGSTCFPIANFLAELGMLAGSTIIVADDDAVVRRLCCRTLQDEGFAVLEAEDGEAALKLIEAHTGTIDLVITDLTMPRLGGYELAEVLSVFRPGLPVLGMSGAAHKLQPDRRLPVLAKPFSASTLITATREMRIRATETRIWAEEKRAQAQELCRIAAAMQLTGCGFPERVDLVAVAQEFRNRCSRDGGSNRQAYTLANSRSQLVPELG